MERCNHSKSKCGSEPQTLSLLRSCEMDIYINSYTAVYFLLLLSIEHYSVF